jgi:hypothetical protein
LEKLRDRDSGNGKGQERFHFFLIKLRRGVPPGNL